MTGDFAELMRRAASERDFPACGALLDECRETDRFALCFAGHNIDWKAHKRRAGTVSLGCAKRGG